MRRATIGIGSLSVIAGAGLAILLMAAGPVTARGQGLDQAPRALASNGAVVEMPDIAALDCTGMEAVLRRIDLSDYRGRGVLSPGHPDWPIFDYEDRLARYHYAECIMRDRALSDPGVAFSFGFEAQ